MAQTAFALGQHQASVAAWVRLQVQVQVWEPVEASRRVRKATAAARSHSLAAAAAAAAAVAVPCGAQSRLSGLASAPALALKDHCSRSLRCPPHRRRRSRLMRRTSDGGAATEVQLPHLLQIPRLPAPPRGLLPVLHLQRPERAVQAPARQRPQVACLRRSRRWPAQLLRHHPLPAMIWTRWWMTSCGQAGWASDEMIVTMIPALLRMQFDRLSPQYLHSRRPQFDRLLCTCTSSR